MNSSRTFLATMLTLAAITASGLAYAQSPTPSPKRSEPSVAAKVETWTDKQWTAAQKKWAKDKKKWNECQSQSDTRKLSGRKSWSFLYDCMTG
jgi:hypothetical protein